jgi:Cysteine-rich CPXCG
VRNPKSALRPGLLQSQTACQKFSDTNHSAYTDADVETQFLVMCPYCGEEVEIYVEPDVRGTIVQDCEVCCNPWRLQIVDDEGERWVAAQRADGSE